MDFGYLFFAGSGPHSRHDQMVLALCEEKGASEIVVMPLALMKCLLVDWRCCRSVKCVLISWMTLVFFLHASYLLEIL